MIKETFPDFPYRVADVVRFVQTKELFTCMLGNGRIIHFCPKDVESFKIRLSENGIDGVSGQ